jgi:hypothetical protein
VPPHVPLSISYDPHERTHGQPLPHLFARRRGTRHEVISNLGVRSLLNATAVHVIGELVGSYPGISDPHVAGQVSHVLHATAIELGNGRSVPIEVRRAVRGLAEALRRAMQPPTATCERPGADA